MAPASGLILDTVHYDESDLRVPDEDPILQ